MMNIEIIEEEIIRNNNSTEGKLYLFNGDVVTFCIDIENGFSQWGSSKEILWQTLERLEELQAELIEKKLG